MSIETRLRALERKNRILMALVVALLAPSALASWSRRDDDVVQARAFEMVDAEGNVRAELGIDADGSAGLFLKDVEGRLRACAIHDSTQTGFFALDDAGQIRVGAAQFAHGGGGFALHGPQGKGSAVLYLKGQGSLTFYGADGAVKNKLAE